MEHFTLFISRNQSIFYASNQITEMNHAGQSSVLKILYGSSSFTDNSQP